MAPVTRSSLKNIENNNNIDSNNNNKYKKIINKSKKNLNKKKTIIKKENKFINKKINSDDDDFDPKKYDESNDSDFLNNNNSESTDDDLSDDYNDKKSIKTKKINNLSFNNKKRKINEKETKIKKEKILNKNIENDEIMNNNNENDDDDDDDDDDWEEVEDIGIYNDNNEEEDFNPDNYNPEIPDNIQISFENNKNKIKDKNKNKHWKWVCQCIRVDMNHERRKNQINAHKTYLLLSIYRIKYLNNIINDQFINAIILSTEFFQKKLMKCKLKNDLIKNEKNFNKFIEIIYKNYKISMNNNKKIKKSTTNKNKNIKNNNDNNNLYDNIINSLETNNINCMLILKFLIIIILRLLNYNVRLCYLLSPVPIKSSNLLTTKTKFQKYIDEPLFGDEIPKVQQTNRCYWLEIFDKNLNKWISIDIIDNDNNIIFNNSIEIINKLKRLQIKFVSYVFAIDNNNYIADVTQRYNTLWFTRYRLKNRIENEWLQETLQPYEYPKNSLEFKAEQQEFDEMLQNIEFPKFRSNYKDNPVFVLERDLLQYQALYPPNPPTLGFIDNEPIYSRFCVHLLKSRERWLRDARTVKLNETPYKIIKSRFKRKKKSSSSILMMDFENNNGNNGEFEREELELFGFWQTEPYESPVAKNGIVPRNAYGNVDLYQKCMLPKNTVLIEAKPSITKLAYRMNIDCAPAVIGFEYKKHPNRVTYGPKIGGYVVCKEFKDKLLKEYENFEKEQQEKEKNLKEKRIYNNWRRIIRGLIIRHNLKIKYGS